MAIFLLFFNPWIIIQFLRCSHAEKLTLHEVCYVNEQQIHKVLTYDVTTIVGYIPYMAVSVDKFILFKRVE